MKRIRIRRRAATVVLVVGLVGALSGSAAAAPLENRKASSNELTKSADCTVDPRLLYAQPELCGRIVDPLVRDVRYRELQSPTSMPSAFELRWWMVAISLLVIGAAIASVRLYPGHSGSRGLA